MNAILGALTSLRVTAGNLFRRKVTEPLPWEGGRARPERYRTSFALVHNEDGDEACIGCRICERICPSQIITVISGGRAAAPKSGKMRGSAKDFTLDLNACIHCELCVQVCPEDAILMLRVPEAPGYSREELFLTMDKLYANEPVEKSWGNATRLLEMQEGPAPPKPPPKPAAEAKPAAPATTTPAAPAATTPAAPATPEAAPAPVAEAPAKPAPSGSGEGGGA